MLTVVLYVLENAWVNKMHLEKMQLCCLNDCQCYNDSCSNYKIEFITKCIFAFMAKFFDCICKNGNDVRILEHQINRPFISGWIGLCIFKPLERFKEYIERCNYNPMHINAVLHNAMQDLKYIIWFNANQEVSQDKSCNIRCNAWMIRIILDDMVHRVD